MSRLDKRTRTSADIRRIDPAAFFERELPSLVEAHGHLAVEGAAELDFQAATFKTDSGAWTLARTGNGFEVGRGDTGVSAVRLSDDDFSDLVNDLTTVSLLRGVGIAKLERGDFSNISGWGTFIRSMVDGRRIHAAGAFTMQDRNGQPLDIDRSFSPDDDDADIAHFLAEAGFLHLSGWLDEDSMNAIAEDIDRALPNCTREDGSWWATLKGGEQVPVRILNFARQSDTLRRILASDAFLRIGRLTDDDYIAGTDAEALQKPIGVAAGLSDIGWHSDCTQGMHSYSCCTLVVGISVTGAGPGSAQLGVVPGSHRALLPGDRLYPQSGLEPRFLTTKTGDMTVHCSCTMHMAKPPTEYERKVLYTGFGLPSSDPGLEAEVQRVYKRRNSVNDTLRESGETEPA